MALNNCKNIDIEHLSCLAKEQFQENYLRTGLPVIIKDELVDMPARSWTLDSLKDRLGSTEVHVRYNTNCSSYKKGQKYNVKQVLFKSYIDDLKAGNARSQNSYLAVQNIKKAYPSIQDDFIVPKYVEKVHGGPYLWIAPKGHYEYCHFDPDDGLLVILQGRKQVRLFSNDHIHKLYPNQLGTKGRTIQSQVDLDDVDLDTFPLFRDAVCYHGVVEAGEMLYIPCMWWHQVTSLEISISVNIFWGDGGETENAFMCKALSAPVWDCFSYWLLNIMEQNREYESFPRMMSRLKEALFHFLYTQWKDRATDEQLGFLIEHIKQHLHMDELPVVPSTGKFPPRLQIRGLLWRD